MSRRWLPPPDRNPAPPPAPRPPRGWSTTSDPLVTVMHHCPIAAETGTANTSLPPVLRLPGRYEILQRGTANVRSLGVHAAPDVQLDTWPERYFIVRKDGGDTPVAVAGPLAEHDCAEALAQLYRSEWRLLAQIGEWITVVDGRLYAAAGAAGDGPSVGVESLRPRCMSEFGREAETVRSIVREAWPGFTDPPPPAWRLHPIRPRSLLSSTEALVHFPATGDPVTLDEARSNQRAVLAGTPEQAGSPRPWRAVPLHYSGIVDWVILDARRHVVVQCGHGEAGAQSARDIKYRFGPTGPDVEAT
jgi:hypothetical protein